MQRKIITQPWWCQSWKNFIWIFWRLIGQLDAWNWNHLDKIWCKIYAKQDELHSSSNFQNSSFLYPDHEEFWSFILTEFVLFWFWSWDFGGRQCLRTANQIARNFFWQAFWQTVASDWSVGVFCTTYFCWVLRTNYKHSQELFYKFVCNFANVIVI